MHEALDGRYIFDSSPLKCSICQENDAVQTGSHVLHFYLGFFLSPVEGFERLCYCAVIS